MGMGVGGSVTTEERLRWEVIGALGIAHRLAGYMIGVGDMTTDEQAGAALVDEAARAEQRCQVIAARVFREEEETDECRESSSGGAKWHVNAYATVRTAE